MGNKIIWSLLILLISFASCGKNNVARQATPQNSARAAVEQAEEDMPSKSKSQPPVFEEEEEEEEEERGIPA
jgi:hypothetical protein